LRSPNSPRAWFKATPHPRHPLGPPRTAPSQNFSDPYTEVPSEDLKFSCRNNKIFIPHSYRSTTPLIRWVAAITTLKAHPGAGFKGSRCAELGWLIRPWASASHLYAASDIARRSPMAPAPQPCPQNPKWGGEPARATGAGCCGAGRDFSSALSMPPQA